jgi:hypothetical protein
MEDVEGGEATEASGEPSATASDAVPPGEASADSSASSRDTRLERLPRILAWVGDPAVARTLRTISDSDVKERSAVIRTALHALRRKRNPTAFLTQSQYRAAVPLIAEAVADECQDAVISALGDAADHPDRDQLLAAIEEVGDRFPVSIVALMLAYVSVTDLPAADVSDAILESDERFTVPDSVPLPD